MCRQHPVYAAARLCKSFIGAWLACNYSGWRGYRYTRQCTERQVCVRARAWGIGWQCARARVRRARRACISAVCHESAILAPRIPCTRRQWPRCALTRVLTPYVLYGLKYDLASTPWAFADYCVRQGTERSGGRCRAL